MESKRSLGRVTTYNQFTVCQWIQSQERETCYYSEVWDSSNHKQGPRFLSSNSRMWHMEEYSFYNSGEVQISSVIFPQECKYVQGQKREPCLLYMSLGTAQIRNKVLNSYVLQSQECISSTKDLLVGHMCNMPILIFTQLPIKHTIPLTFLCTRFRRIITSYYMNIKCNTYDKPKGI